MAATEPQRSDSALANPAPLGLMGFGVTTVLLNLANAGYYPADSVILAMGLFYGGVAQIIAGIVDFRKGNTFGATAFTSYGLFWLTFVALFFLPPLGLGPTESAASLSSYLFVWGLFTVLMFFGTLKMNGALMAVFGTLALLFFLLAAGAASGNESISRAAGYEGVVCGLTAMYASIATLLNEVYRRQVLPVFPVGQKA